MKNIYDCTPFFPSILLMFTILLEVPAIKFQKNFVFFTDPFFFFFFSLSKLVPFFAFFCSLHDSIASFLFFSFLFFFLSLFPAMQPAKLIYDPLTAGGLTEIQWGHSQIQDLFFKTVGQKNKNDIAARVLSQDGRPLFTPGTVARHLRSLRNGMSIGKSNENEAPKMDGEILFPFSCLVYAQFVSSIFFL